MDRIKPTITTNYMVRPRSDGPKLVKVIGEFGVYGYCIGDENSLTHNKVVGHCLRTKLSHVNEGGVAAGLGALDSPFLVDSKKCCEDEPCC